MFATNRSVTLALVFAIASGCRAHDEPIVRAPAPLEGEWQRALPPVLPALETFDNAASDGEDATSVCIATDGGTCCAAQEDAGELSDVCFGTELGEAMRAEG